MPTFIDNTGEKFVAANAKELVRQMAKTSFDESDASLHEYMRAMASRAEVAASVTLRADSCDNFVADLLMNNLLKTEN